MPTLTKAVLATEIVTKLGLSDSEAKSFVTDFYKGLQQALETGQHVKLSGFGNFMLSDKSPRPGRNPKTGEDVEITARRVVKFKAGYKLKQFIENNTAIIEKNQQQ